MPIKFSTGELHVVKFYITKLDEEYLVVLGYNCLTCHKLATLKLMPTTTMEVDICWVSAQAMTKLHQDLENATFMISPDMHQYKLDPQVGEETLRARSAKAALTETFPDTILKEYLEFHKVFSGEKANVLAPHRLYNLKINLEEGAKPFHGLVYSLLPPEL